MTRRPKLTSQNIKRSVVVGGRKTSVGLEDAFWLSLKEVAAHEGVPITTLVTRIDTERLHANLSSAVRIYVLEHYRRLADGAAPGGMKGKQS
jgi:predicted DNA-binding ribbon-helix-helix protein